MDTASRSPRGSLGWLPALTVATALALAGCGTDTDNGPATTTTAPTAQTSSTTTTSATTTSSSVAPTTTSPAGAATPAEAVEAWLSGEGYAYAGDCTGATIGPVQKWCSTLVEDRGEERTYKVGRVSSQYRYSLRLEKSDGRWSVVDVEEITVGP